VLKKIVGAWWSRRMEIGVQLPQLGAQVDRATLRAFVQEAEASGFDSFWVQDHFLWPYRPQSGYAGRPGAPIPQEYRSVLAPLELLAFTAALSERGKIGTSILVTAYHVPARLAQQLSTLDMLSGGRVICGLGLGWSKDEYDQFGTPFAERGRRMTDFIRALRACWAPNPVEYHGRFFDVPPADISPKPLQRDESGRPAIPIVLGQSSPAGLRRVAELADGWNPAGRSAEAVAAELSELQRLAAGRDGRLTSYLRVFIIPAERSATEVQTRPFGPIAWRGPAAALRERVAEAAAAGIDHLIVDTSFSGEIDEPAAWLGHLRYLETLPEAAHAASGGGSSRARVATHDSG
jgi:probable F420-dependent oxidoreductase